MSDAAKADKQAGLSCFYLRKLTKMVEAPLFFMCILRFYVPVDLFVSLCGNDPAVVKVSVHNSLAELAKAVGFDIKAPTVPAEQGISETEVAAVVSSAL